MGIHGLLPHVKKACRPCRISEFRGSTIAVDACCWLHKGVFGCADKLALGQETDFYVQYCMKMVNSLLSHGVKVILVFDGASLPAKKQTNETRKQRRELAREKGHRSLAEGNLSEANGFFRQGMNITSEMVSDVIEACNSLRNSNVKCIVAPYEADAQLAYLNLNRFADVVLSEDSDLILFGCKKIIFKFDQHCGDLYDLDELPNALGKGDRSKFDFVTFRRTCILSGCDYASGLPGIGLVKASRFFQKISAVSNRDIRKCLKRVPLVLNMRDLRVSDEFVEQFVAAENTFLYQLVFDPEKRTLVPLNPYPDALNAEAMPYAGKLLDDQIAIEIAIGQLCPHSHRRRGKSIEKGSKEVDMAIVKKRRTPIKSPTKRLSKSPRKTENALSKSAFEVGHVRAVVHSRNSPKKAANLERLFGRSSTVTTMYGSASDSEQSLTRSRYFGVVSSTSVVDESKIEIDESVDDEPNITRHRFVNKFSKSVSAKCQSQTESRPSSSKKRSVFECLGDQEDDGDTDESGFYGSGNSTSFITSTPTSPISKKTSFTKNYSFRPLLSQDDDNEKTKPILLSSFSATLNRFRYGASQD